MWLSVIPSTVNGTELGAQEWRDSLFLRYGIDPPDPPDHCKGCGVALLIYHSLDFNKGSLITERHNELRDGAADLSCKAFIPAHMRDEPKSFIGRAILGGKAKSKSKG